MERGGHLPDEKRRPRTVARAGARAWRDAVRRGAILGGVLGGHVIVLMLVMHPWWRRIAPVARQREALVLRLSFDRLPKPAPPGLAAAAPHLPVRTKPARRPIEVPMRTFAVVVPATKPLNAPATSLITTMPSVAADPDRGYQPGSFQSALHNAQRAKPDHIPGSITPIVTGIQLQTHASAKAIALGLVSESRCTNMQFQLQDSAHQLTPAMIDHALEVEGCGPHLERTSLDATIDAVSQQSTSGY